MDLAGEAIRLARQLTLATEEPEARGLLALMLLNHARLPARFDAEGRIVTLDRQDRGLWDTREIAEGVRVLRSALAVQRPGRYQIEAAIAALHDDAARAEETDWPQILAWYDDLVALTDDPVRSRTPPRYSGARSRWATSSAPPPGCARPTGCARCSASGTAGTPSAAICTSSAATSRPPPRRTPRPHAGDERRRTRPPGSPSRPRAGLPSYVGTVVSLSVLHRLACPAMKCTDHGIAGRLSPSLARIPGTWLPDSSRPRAGHVGLIGSSGGRSRHGFSACVSTRTQPLVPLPRTFTYSAPA